MRNKAARRTALTGEVSYVPMRSKSRATKEPSHGGVGDADSPETQKKSRSDALVNRTPEILTALRQALAAAPAADLPAIIGQIEAVKAEAYIRLMTETAAPTEKIDDSKLLTVDEVAAHLGQSARWVRDHKHELPRVVLPGRLMRFSAKRLESMIKRRS
jgi:hypothetical protein